jgi:hypothetical protein
MTAGLRAFVAALAILLAALAVLFHRELIRGEVFSPADVIYSFYPWAYVGPRLDPSNITRSDEAAFHLPMMATHWQRLRQGDFPDWQAYELSGAASFFQGLNAGMAFSPLSLPFYLTSPERAVTLYAPLRLLCAGLFMWLFLHHGGLRFAGAITGALAFALTGPFIAWLSAPIPTVALFLPLMLLFAERTARFARAGDAAALAIVVGLQFWGSYLPTSIVTTAVAGAYAATWLITERGGTPRGRRAGALACAGLGSLAIGAVALGPMLASLATSPATARSMTHVRLPAANLVTLVLPDFFGSPVDRNWWHPAAGNYPEYITYVGVTVLLLAGAGLAGAERRQRLRMMFLVAVPLLVVPYMYGAQPVAALRELPGLRQTNPLRFNIAFAFAAAALAAHGVHALASGPHRRRALVGCAAAAVLAGGIAAATTAAYLDMIRAHHLQAYVKVQIAAAALLGLATTAGAAVAALARPAVAGAAAAALALIVSIDLLLAGMDFNPSVPPDRYYPSTPGIEFARRRTAGGRVAPIDQGSGFFDSHVWSMYGLETPTGYDFYGDTDYQRYLAAASGAPFTGARWDYVRIDPRGALDLKLLGLLNVTALITSPEDAAARPSGYATVGELIDGRVVRQTFRAVRNGLRRVDVLAAAFGRTNDGRIRLRVLDDAGVEVAGRDVPQSAFPETDWLALEFTPVPVSAGRRFTLEVAAAGASTGHAATLWGSAGEGYPDGTLTIDGRDEGRDLVFRAFSAAPDRWAGALLEHSGDLNVYRNTHAMPRAWFVDRVEPLERSRHLDRLLDAGFDPRTTAVVEGLAAAGAGDARVLEIERTRGDVRTIRVEAPAGGVLVVSERARSGWTAVVDGRPAPLAVANAVLMAVPVPRGSREIVLRYVQPAVRRSAALSGVAIACALLVLVGTARSAHTS